MTLDGRTISIGLTSCLTELVDAQRETLCTFFSALAVRRTRRRYLETQRPRFCVVFVLTRNVSGRRQPLCLTRCVLQHYGFVGLCNTKQNIDVNFLFQTYGTDGRVVNPWTQVETL